MGHAHRLATDGASVNDRTDVQSAISAARADLLTLVERLDGIQSAAASSPETQARVLELVDALALRARALTPDESLVIDGLLTVEGATQFLALSETTVRGMMERGEIRCTRIGGRVLIPRLALVKLAADCLDAPRPEARARKGA